VYSLPIATQCWMMSAWFHLPDVSGAAVTMAALPSAAQLQFEPATCLVVALTRLKKLVVAIIRTRAASPCSS
jgi:hypothetical protein